MKKKLSKLTKQQTKNTLRNLFWDFEIIFFIIKFINVHGRQIKSTIMYYTKLLYAVMWYVHNVDGFLYAFTIEMLTIL